MNLLTGQPTGAAAQRTSASTAHTHPSSYSPWRDMTCSAPMAGIRRFSPMPGPLSGHTQSTASAALRRQ
eukprot:409316-Rhodomonas_salina.2